MGAHVKRFDDHDLRLIAFAREQLGKSFEWGATNCVMLALRALDVQCGTDIAARHCRIMASERRAMAWVARHGLPGLVERLLAEGTVEVPPTHLQCGDVALVEMPGNIGAAVYLGRAYLSSSATLGVIQLRPADLALPSIVLGVR